MSSRVSRRELFAAGVGLAAVLVAGYTDEAESSNADCETGAVGHGDPEVLQEMMVRPDGDDALLHVHLVGGAPKSTDRLRVYDPAGDLEHEIPTVGRTSSISVRVRRTAGSGPFPTTASERTR